MIPTEYFAKKSPNRAHEGNNMDIGYMCFQTRGPCDGFNLLVVVMLSMSLLVEKG